MAGVGMVAGAVMGMFRKLGELTDSLVRPRPPRLRANRDHWITPTQDPFSGANDVVVAEMPDGTLNRSFGCPQPPATVPGGDAPAL